MLILCTGYGAATKTANVQEGDNVAVFGIGCVGLAVLQGCAARKCGRIIAVDTNANKEAWAKKMGATEFIVTGKLPQGKDIASHLVDITDGGLDHTLQVFASFRR
jgi:S-(hydroxymethyl)glutathione dehydrogenase/alcohol dehydrogenase